MMWICLNAPSFYGFLLTWICCSCFPVDLDLLFGATVSSRQLATNSTLQVFFLVCFPGVDLCFCRQKKIRLVTGARTRT
jgi:hypothetical protein